MKTQIFIPVFAVLTLAFLWSCEQELVGPSDTPIETRSHKPNHNNSGNNGGGNNGGGEPEAIYAVQYTGSIVTSDVAYLVVTAQTGRKIEFHSICDGSFATITTDTVSTNLQGLNSLFTFLSPPADCYDANECSWSISMGEDTKKNPGRLKVTFWFEDPSEPGGNLRFSMFGDILGEFPPTSTTVPTEVDLDRWAVVTAPNYTPQFPECIHDNSFFSDDGIPNQRLIVRLVDQEVEGDGPVLCAGKAGCAN